MHGKFMLRGRCIQRPAPSGRRRADRRTLGTAAVLAATLIAGGCASSSTAGGDTTCGQWVELEGQLDVEEQIADSDGLSGEAAAVVEDALREADLSTDELNVQTARASILQYCGPDGTGNRPNIDEPISNALTR